MIINNLHQLVEEQTKKTPNAIALLYLDKEMSYAQLNEKSNQLAHYLSLKNLAPEEPIAICMERCFDLFVAILAVLKVGCAYVPLEPRHPAKRLQGVVEDCQARIVLTQSHLVSAFKDLAVEKIRLDVERDLLRTQKAENLDLVIAPDRLAYIIYTSGSTGRPKGVCIEHRNACSFSNALAKLFPITAQDKVLQFTSISFDVSVMEWITAFSHGATLCLLPTSTKKTLIDALIETAPRYEVTFASMTPGMAHNISPDLLPTVKTLVVAGEACTEKLVSSWSNRVLLINAYGPTETTVLATAFSCDLKHPAATIGFPLDNTNIYIFDDHLNPVSGSNTGEIYIGGQSVARGYLNRPDLTEKHFIPNPFKIGERLYKTGDLACYLSDGAINYLGRNDNQVKIRGHRVELQEIENVFLKLAPLQNVIVITDPLRKDKLIAFASPKLNELNEKQDLLLQKAAALLPRYMLPDSLIFLDRIPLNTSGKYDKEILYQYYKNKKKHTAQNFFEENYTTIEKKLIQICRDLLNYEELYPESDLLSNGLDSIMILQFISRAREQGLSIQTKQVYQKRTIRRIASIAQEHLTNAISIPPALVPNQYFDLSPIQRWIFEEDFIDYRWTQAGYIEIQDSDLQIDKLEQAYHDLVKYHSSLSLQFTKTAAGWQQAYSLPSSSSLPLSVIPINDFSDIKNRTKKISQAISIKIGLLVQALLFHQSSSNTYYFYIVVHHLAIDGISWRILLEDLSKLYHAYAKQEEPKITQTLSYQAWIEKLQATLKQPMLWEELEYWDSVLRKASTCLFMEKNSEHARVENRKTLCFSLDREETNALLHEIHTAYHTEINDVLLAALAGLFQQLEGETKLSLLIDRHGRESFIAENSDFSRTVGWFTSISPVYLEFVQSKPEYLIPSIKAQLQAIPHCGIGYGLLKHLTGDDPRTAYLRAASEPRINFNYMGQWNLNLEMTPKWHFMNLDLESGFDEKSCMTEDLLLLSCIKDGQFRLFLTYNKVHNNQEIMMNWGETYLDCLRHLIQHCKDQNIITKGIIQEIAH